ncbi:hypothetical protein J6TS1_27910 [Siminovitchia terrae]|uniref:Lipoprotein n=1 Tax=Siminovitchia terrae TaxID=1914933 RepID=A0ABQ4KY89_SIMTE|nr:hypothetical protein [Siminovitchia terrae]GIN96921.1 hypothetical protein J6TS1_27910 [Siminovitchia terrae]
MKKSIIISIIAASTLLLQGCNNTTSSKASENKTSDAELQAIKKERDSLEKTNNELTKKIADLESKTNKEPKTYTLDEKLAQKVYSIYTGQPWDNNIYDAGWAFTKESDTNGIITADRGGGQPIYLLSNYVVIFETGLNDSMGQLEIIDLNTETVIDRFPKEDIDEHNNQETTQKPSTNTDKTFIAPKTYQEGLLNGEELRMALLDYLMPADAEYEDYELELNSDGVYILRADNHLGNMVVVGHYVIDENGYVYKYNFVNQTVHDTPETNLYLED